MIPQEKTAAVTRGMRETFGVTEFEDIRLMSGGNSTSRVFRIVVGGTAYLLKTILRQDDPARHFACMRAAADAGLAPRVWYTSVEDRVLITDFVEAVPLPVAEALLRTATVLHKLHALPAFPPVPDPINTSCMFLLNKGPALDGFLQKIRAANILTAGESEELFGLYERLAAAYQRQEADMVSSHNDLLKPDNIVFDGERVWLVDWEASFLNDRYADLAVAANHVVTNEAEERAYLQEYFGQAPDEYQSARFFLMQQVAHLFYTLGFLFLGSFGPPLTVAEGSPGFRDFQRRMWAREVDLADRGTKILYARAHREQLLRNTRQERFNESLRIVTGRNSHP